MNSRPGPTHRGPDYAEVVMTSRGEVFSYVGWQLEDREVVCSYDLDGRLFTERITLPHGPGLASAALTQVARLLFLLAGVSYYKTSAPPVLDLRDTPVTAEDRLLLGAFFRQGLGEFAVVNHLDLSDLVVVGGAPPPEPAPHVGAGLLIPFGGGIDSVVVVEEAKRLAGDAALFVLGSYAAIEAPLAITGLPVLRATRQLDPQVLTRDPAFLNGHVPVTGILSAIALATAVVTGREAVVMSNEHSASEATVHVDGREVNHQWSKSREFEDLLRASLVASVPGLDYFSLLRARSELWVAERFAELERYHPVFRSCNRAFAIDPSRRLAQWCGECDKCCFIDLILAPYLSAAELNAIFTGREPLANAALLPRFRSLLGDDEFDKPFECVGDAQECRAAAILAAARPDRAGWPMLQALAPLTVGAPDSSSLLAPIGEDNVPVALRSGGPDPVHVP